MRKIVESMTVKVNTNSEPSVLVEPGIIKEPEPEVKMPELEVKKPKVKKSLI